MYEYLPAYVYLSHVLPVSQNTSESRGLEVTVLLFLFCICVCVACIYVCAPNVQYSWRPEESVRSPGIGVTEDYEPPYGCWVQNLGPL